jgi:WS/DGAT/MGAT family acyltransferase
MIDGIAGVDLMKILLSLTPEVESNEPPPFIPRPAPSGFELLRDELWRRAWFPVQAARDLRNFVSEARDTRRDLLVRLRAAAETLGATLRSASETPLNREIGPHRRFDWLSMDLAEMKALRKTLGGSLNDVVLTVVAGALRRFLERRQVNPRQIEFRVLAPVSVRAREESGTLGNRVSAWVLELPIGEKDPRKRLRQISKRTAELKQSKQAVGAEVLTQMAEWTPSTLLALGARNATRLLPFNMVVTNVPGPQFPMYMLGARMLDVYPHVPLADNLGLGIALLSYDGKLGWGFNADYDLVPDLGALVNAIRQSFQELQEIAREVTVAPARRSKARGRARTAASEEVRGEAERDSSGNGASATT